MMVVLRHGERSDYSQEDIAVKNPFDPVLTSKGKSMALQTAQQLQSLIPNTSQIVLISSPFRRCIETAQPISTLFNIPITLNLHLSEFLKASWYDHQNPIPGLDYFHSEYAIDENFGMPEFPENIMQCQNRYEMVFERLIQDYNVQMGAKVIAVTHAQGVKTFAKHFGFNASTALGPGYTKPNLCGITIFKNGVLDKVNDISHLN